MVHVNEHSEGFQKLVKLFWWIRWKTRADTFLGEEKTHRIFHIHEYFLKTKKMSKIRIFQTNNGIMAVSLQWDSWLARVCGWEKITRPTADQEHRVFETD